jgi:hydroxyacylglutathione hydrolase
VAFYVPDYQVLFGGDVLFQGSIGRTDLPGGDYELLMKSIAQKFLTLPIETRIFPGHGPATSIEQERLYNPFIKHIAS